MSKLITDIVRLAVRSDAAPIMELLRVRHGESGLGAFDAEKTADTVLRGLERDRSMIGVIKGRYGVEASIGLFMGSPWDSADEYISDLWTFVLPDYRKSQHAKNLLLFAKWAATELGRPLLMAHFNNEKTARLGELYLRQLPAAGMLFLLRPGIEAPLPEPVV